MKEFTQDVGQEIEEFSQDVWQEKERVYSGCRTGKRKILLRM